MARRRNKRQQGSSTADQHDSTPDSSSSRDFHGYKMPPPMERLPFTLSDAAENPWKCGEQVNAFVWEEQVEQPLIQAKYSSDPPEHYKEETQYLPQLSEIYYAERYHFGLSIARGHYEIADVLLNRKDVAGCFEKSWQTGDDQEESRKVMVIMALSQTTMTMGGIGTELRRLCPELSAQRLAVNNGQALVELVRFIAQSGSKFKGSDYYPIPNHDFERYYSIENDKGLPPARALPLNLLSLQHHRNLFITRFVFYLLAIGEYGLDIKQLPGALLEKPCLTIPAEGAQMSRGGNLVDSSSSLAKSISAPLVENEYPNSRPMTAEDNGGRPIPRRIDACICCRRFRDEVKELVEGKKQFSYCKKCLSLDPPHRVPYCSQECQVKEWSTHRLICGKLFLNPDTPQFGTTAPPTLGAPLSISLQFKLYKIKIWNEGENAKFGDEGTRKLYGFRYLDPSFHPRPTGGPNEAAWLGRGTAWLTRAIRVKEGEDEVDEIGAARERAVETRNLDDIRAFLLSIWPMTAMIGQPYTRSEAIAEFASDWDVEVETIRDWVSAISEDDIHAGGRHGHGGPLFERALMSRNLEELMRLMTAYAMNDPERNLTPAARLTLAGKDVV